MDVYTVYTHTHTHTLTHTSVYIYIYCIPSLSYKLITLSLTYHSLTIHLPTHPLTHSLIHNSTESKYNTSPPTIQSNHKPLLPTSHHPYHLYHPYQPPPYPLHSSQSIPSLLPPPTKRSLYYKLPSTIHSQTHSLSINQPSKPWIERTLGNPRTLQYKLRARATVNSADQAQTSWSKYETNVFYPPPTVPPTSYCTYLPTPLPT